MIVIRVSFILALVGSVGMMAQAPPSSGATFEVVSIRRNTTNEVLPGPEGGSASGHFWLSNVTAGNIVFRG